MFVYTEFNVHLHKILVAQYNEVQLGSGVFIDVHYLYIRTWDYVRMLDFIHLRDCCLWIH